MLKSYFKFQAFPNQIESTFYETESLPRKKKKTFHIKRTFAAQLQFLCIQPIRQQTSPLHASNSQSMMSKRLANFGKQDVKGRLEDCENRASVSQEDLLQTSVCVFSTSLYDRLEVSHTNNQTYNINMQ